MPRVHLEAKAELENVARVAFKPPYVLDMQQTGGSEQRMNVEVDDSESHEIFGSKGTVHFAMKWDKRDKHEATCSVLGKGEITASGKWTRVASFETRGLELMRFHVTIVSVVAASGAPFEDCDVSDPSEGWADYDERAQKPVSVSEMEFRFVSG